VNLFHNTCSKLVAAAFVSLAVVVPSAAMAQGEPTVEEVRQAGEEFNLGRAAFQSEDYSTAAEHFERADSLAPNNKVLLLAIQARDLAGHASRAATLAALAQDRYPSDGIFAESRQLITTALQEQGKLKVVCEPACTLLVDGRLVHGQPSTKRFIFLESGEHSVVAGWGEGEAQTQAFSAAAGESGKLEFRLASSTGGAVAGGAMADDGEEQIDWGDEQAEDDALPKPKITYDSVDESPVDQGADSSDGLPPTVFWVGAGLTAAMVGVSTWSGIDTQNNPGRDAVEEACQSGESNCRTLYQQGKNAEQRTNILWGVTAGVGLTTILIGSIWTDWGGPDVPADMDDLARSKRKRESVAVSPWLDFNGGAGIGARGRF
jgi:hypothetical protein